MPASLATAGTLRPEAYVLPTCEARDVLRLRVLLRHERRLPGAQVQLPTKTCSRADQLPPAFEADQPPQRSSRGVVSMPKSRPKSKSPVTVEAIIDVAKYVADQ